VIIAHLGNGASLAAIKDGQSIDTSMGFTPASGLVMGTRPGDLDPGVAWFLMKMENLSPKEYNNLINHQSGLLGVSGNSSDMRDLLDSQAGDDLAAEAVELFCYQARKWIGAYAAVLEGLDILVFAGGIGESSSEIRRRICGGLGFLGIDIDEAHNDNNAEIISKTKSPVQVHVMHTDEESVIAENTCRVLNIALGKGSYHENVKR
jgi:acetate kinase